MKVIFLDIDGVLNNRDLLDTFGIDCISFDLVKILKRIVEATEAKIVLSSDWRLKLKDQKLVREALGEVGLDFIDRTDQLRNAMTSFVERSFEILEWLSRHQTVKEFAILDDNYDAGTNGLRDYFFKTDDKIGLTEEIADKVIEHLGVKTAA